MVGQVGGVSRIDEIVAIVKQCSFRWSSEYDIHRGLLQWLQKNQQHLPSFRSEVSLSKRDRLDVLLDDGTAIEIKVDGSKTEVLRQLHRYAEHEEVTGLVLLTTRMTHTLLPPTVLDKRLAVVTIIGL